MSLRAVGLVLVTATALSVAAPVSAADAVPPRPSAGCGLDQIEHGRHLPGRMEVGGVARDYIVDVPDSVRPRVSAPLLLDFHGFGHSSGRSLLVWLHHLA